MGCVENYANAFLGKFEGAYIYPYIRSSVIFYCQFMDDLFLLWNGSEIELLDFIAKLNTCQSTIKIDYKHFQNSIDF